MVADRIELILSKDEALVMFEWLSSLDSSANGPPENSAECKVLWKIEAQLEKKMVEPFSKNYSLLLEDARKRVLEST